LAYLIQDLQRGEIPLGGEKTSGFGWVQGQVTHLEWLTGDPAGVSQQLFGERTLTRDGIWHRLELEGAEAVAALQAARPLIAEEAQVGQTPPKTAAGYISHRAFGGHCGVLAVEAEVLTPLHIRESGEPSFKVTLSDGPVNGWDFFSMSPPAAEHRPAQRLYALPSFSIRGTLRHIYAIASDSREPSPDIEHLNATDRLFGWVGTGPNQALMGRLVFSFGTFQDPELAWFKVPFPYGEWQFDGQRWQQVPGSSARLVRIKKTWRLFPHTPPAPIVEQLDDFQPDTSQARDFRAILPGARARFTIRFWNLEDEELQRLIWCVVLEPGLAHKMGRSRYLGLGSVRWHILPESYLIDWAKRYAGAPEEEWRLPIQVDEWHNPQVVAHYSELRKGLDAKQL
jgi:CRISPR/Cas system CSM-associated protein Csm3 (group 7 of RAMP superfamily)